MLTNDVPNLNLSKPLGVQEDLDPDLEEEAKKVVLGQYHNYVDIFSEEKAKQLPPYWEWDHHV